MRVSSPTDLFTVMNEFYKATHAQISDAFDDVFFLFERFRTFKKEDDEKIEIELRFGQSKCIDGRITSQFIPGVSESFFYICYQMLSGYKEWTHFQDFNHVVDYFYNNEQGQEIRTRVGSLLDEKNSNGFSTLTTENITKRRINTEDFCIMSQSGFNGSVRVQLSSEKKANLIQSNDVPHTCYPVKFVRIKQISSFTYRHVWRFDFAKVWSGNCFADADRKFQNLDLDSSSNFLPSYEIELEFIGNDHSSSDKSAVLSASMLLKAIDLVGVGSVLKKF